MSSWTDLETGRSKALSGLSPFALKSDRPTEVGCVDFSPLCLPLELHLLQKPSPPPQNSVGMKSGPQGSGRLGLNPSSAPHWLCVLGRVTELLCAYVLILGRPYLRTEPCAGRAFCLGCRSRRSQACARSIGFPWVLPLACPVTLGVSCNLAKPGLGCPPGEWLQDPLRGGEIRVSYRPRAQKGLPLGDSPLLPS